MWASAYTVVEDRLVVAGGAALDSSVLTNEAFAYDPVSDSWSTLPPSHHALLRSSGACGFVKIGGQFEAWPGDVTVEQLPGYDDCRPTTDVAWVRASPDHARVGPDRTRARPGAPGRAPARARDARGLPAGARGHAVRRAGRPDPPGRPQAR